MDVNALDRWFARAEHGMQPALSFTFGLRLVKWGVVVFCSLSDAPRGAS